MMKCLQLLLAIIGFSLIESALAPNTGQVHGDIVFRDDFGTATSSSGVGSTFVGGNEFAGVADLGIANHDRMVTDLQWASVLSTDGIANVGNMSKQEFLIVGVNDFDNFKIDFFRDAYNSNQDYQFVSDVLRISQASNIGYDTPYDTSGTFHLYDLQFKNLNLHVPAGEVRGFDECFNTRIGFHRGGCSSSWFIHLQLIPNRFQLFL